MAEVYTKIMILEHQAEVAGKHYLKYSYQIGFGSQENQVLYTPQFNHRESVVALLKKDMQALYRNKVISSLEYQVVCPTQEQLQPTVRALSEDEVKALLGTIST